VLIFKIIVSFVATITILLVTGILGAICVKAIEVFGAVALLGMLIFALAWYVVFNILDRNS
jgi:hypothetical protein